MAPTDLHSIIDGHAETLPDKVEKSEALELQNYDLRLQLMQDRLTKMLADRDAFLQTLCSKYKIKPGVDELNTDTLAIVRK